MKGVTAMEKIIVDNKKIVYIQYLDNGEFDLIVISRAGRSRRFKNLNKRQAKEKLAELVIK